MEPVEVVRTCFDAYVRGDIARMVGLLAENVTWIDPGYPDLPYAGTRHGPLAVAELLRDLDAHFAFNFFDPPLYVPSGPDVAVFAGFSVKARRTGKSTATPWATLWRTLEGKVASFQAYLDTSALAAALRS